MPEKLYDIVRIGKSDLPGPVQTGIFRDELSPGFSMGQI